MMLHTNILASITLSVLLSDKRIHGISILPRQEVVSLPWRFSSHWWHQHVSCVDFQASMTLNKHRPGLSWPVTWLSCVFPQWSCRDFSPGRDLRGSCRGHRSHSAELHCCCESPGRCCAMCQEMWHLQGQDPLGPRRRLRPAGTCSAWASEYVVTGTFIWVQLNPQSVTSKWIKMHQIFSVFLRFILWPIEVEMQMNEYWAVVLSDSFIKLVRIFIPCLIQNICFSLDFYMTRSVSNMWQVTGKYDHSFRHTCIVNTVMILMTVC